MLKTPSLTTRQFHRWSAVISALPVVLIISTGILLHLKGQLPWIQPPQVRGSTSTPSLSFGEILEITQKHPQTQVSGWKDLNTLDVRPAQGVIRVRAKNGYELQLDASTGKILEQGMRRTALLISLHEGSWFGNSARFGIFLPAGILLFLLWLTGLYLFIQPLLKRRQARRQQNVAPRT